MKVKVAETAGFCFGVKRAVDKVYELIDTEQKPIFTLGPIIHNEGVVADLEARGVHVIAEADLDSPDDTLQNGTVVIRSHGVGKAIYDKLKEKDVAAEQTLLQVKDALQEAEMHLEDCLRQRTAGEEEQERRQQALNQAHAALLAANDELHAMRENVTAIQNRIDAGRETAERLKNEGDSLQNRLKLIEATLNQSDGGMGEAEKLRQQAAELSDRNVIVIPTKTMMQGMAAAMAYAPENTLDVNRKRMEKAAANVVSGAVTYAVRDTSCNGLTIAKGDIIGLKDNAITSVGKTVEDATLSLVEKMLEDREEAMVTLYFGEGVTEEQANELSERIMAKLPDTEIIAIPGGQPLYYYYISVE